MIVHAAPTSSPPLIIDESTGKGRAAPEETCRTLHPPTGVPPTHTEKKNLKTKAEPQRIARLAGSRSYSTPFHIKSYAKDSSFPIGWTCSSARPRPVPSADTTALLDLGLSPIRMQLGNKETLDRASPAWILA